MTGKGEQGCLVVKPEPPALNHLYSGPDGNESTCKAGDPGSILGLGRSTGEGNGYLLEYSCLENFMDRGAWPL